MSGFQTDSKTESQAPKSIGVPSHRVYPTRLPGKLVIQPALGHISRQHARLQHHGAVPSLEQVDHLPTNAVQEGALGTGGYLPNSHLHRGQQLSEVFFRHQGLPNETADGIDKRAFEP